MNTYIYQMQKGGRPLRFVRRSLSLSAARNLICFLLLFAGLGLPAAFGQNPSYRKVIKAADGAFDERDYYNAFKLYEVALDYPQADLGIKFKYAESARMVQSFWNAKKVYEEILASEDYDEYLAENPGSPVFLTALYLGEMYLIEENCEKAVEYFNRFLDNNENASDRYLTQARQGISNCAFGEELRSVPPLDTLYHLGAEVNTTSMEFAPLRRGDVLYYSSYRFEDEEDKKGRLFFRSLEWEVGSARGERIPGLDHPGRHVGHPSLSSDGSRIYYTVCEYTDRFQVRCDIYYRDRMTDGRWGDAVYAPFNDPDSTNTMPSVVYEELGNPRNETIYFVSNRAPGDTGLDIYFVARNGENFSPPQSLDRTINTNADEVSPYYASRERALYFSTNFTSVARPSVGGFDIYKSRGFPGNWGEPEPLAYPNNTSYDDIYYSLTEDEKTAYLASNRLIPEGDSVLVQPGADRCCHDLFEVKRVTPNLRFNVSCCEESPITDANVKVYKLLPNGGQEEISRTECTGDFDYCFPVDLQGRYQVTVRKTGFTEIDEVVTIDSELMAGSANYDTSFLVSQKLRITVENDETNEPVNQAMLTFYEAGAGSGYPLYQETVDSNVFDFPICLQAGYSYVMRVEHPDYETVVDNELLADLAADLVCNPFALQLPLTKIDPCPLDTVQLFFDNDYPDPDTRITESSYSYADDHVYQRYKEHGEKWGDELREEYERMSPSEKEGFDLTYQVGAMQGFFNNSVRQGFLDLNQFENNLIQELEEGKTVRLNLSGHASRLARGPYNHYLSQRRISTVVNFLRDSLAAHFGRESAGYDPEMRSGFSTREEFAEEMVDYQRIRYKSEVEFTFENGARLILYLKPQGESASEEVSTEQDDLARAIFSIDASQERYVSINPICEEEETTPPAYSDPGQEESYRDYTPYPEDDKN